MMGQMGAITPARSSSRQIPRNQVSLNDIKNVGKHAVVFQRDPKSTLKSIKYEGIRPYTQDTQNLKLDIMWHISMHLFQPWPLSSGYMQSLHTQIANPGKSSQLLLPKIHLSPNSPTCVRSTLST